MSRHLLYTSLMILVLAGCAITPTSTHMTTWQHASAANWRLDGRIAVFSKGEGWHAGIQWAQEGDNFRIKLLGPLGQGAVRLLGDTQGVTLVTADDRHFVADNPEQLLFRQTGWRLPVSGLRYWVRGLPQPGSASHIESDHQGRPSRIRQSGWIINIPRFSDTEEGELPAFLLLERDSVRVKLIIDRWRPTTPGFS